MVTRGILVGSDEKSEWLLPIWWKYYSLHFTHPVAFIDLGLSENGKKFCKERGELIPFEVDVSHPIERTNPPIGICDGGGMMGFREFRNAWLKKPFACFLSPFDETIWIDIDCMIIKPIDFLFSTLSTGVDIAITQEFEECQNYAKSVKIIKKDETLYNSGVIVFSKKSETIKNWIKVLYTGNYLFPGDQDALSKAIALNKPKITELSRNYNWPWFFPKNDDAHIIHFLGPRGKEVLRNQTRVNDHADGFPSL